VKTPTPGPRGRVEVWRGGLGAACRFPTLSVAGASLASPCSVSRPRSSNRTCGFPASGSRRRFTRSRAASGRRPSAVEVTQRSAPTTDSSTSTAPVFGCCAWDPTTGGTDTGRVC